MGVKLNCTSKFLSSQLVNQRGGKINSCIEPQMWVASQIAWLKATARLMQLDTCISLYKFPGSCNVNMNICRSERWKVDESRLQIYVFRKRPHSRERTLNISYQRFILGDMAMMRLRLDTAAVRLCHPGPFLPRGAVGTSCRSMAFHRHILVQSYLLQLLGWEE